MALKPLCLAPFISINVSAYGLSPCCHLSSYSQANTLSEYLQDPNILSLQEKHLTGDIEALPRLCKLCIADKTNTTFNDLGYARNEEYTTLFESDKGLVTLLLANDFTCGYSCNICVTSDKRYKEWDALGRDLYKEVTLPIEAIRKEFDVIETIKENHESLRRVTFAGGDPSLNPDTPGILECLEEYPDIEVIYHVNGQMNTLPDGSRLWSRLNKIKKLWLFFSSDGTEEINTMSRIGYKTKRFKRLVDEAVVEVPNAKFGIMMALSVINVMRLEESIRYIHDTYISRGFILAISPVSYPEWYSPGIIPNKLRLSVLKTLKELLVIYPTGNLNSAINDVLGAFNNQRHSPQLWGFYQKERTRLDKLHNVDSLELNPEYKPYWLLE